jgi:hypothetical protein
VALRCVEDRQVFERGCDIDRARGGFLKYGDDSVEQSRDMRCHGLSVTTSMEGLGAGNFEPVGQDVVTMRTQHADDRTQVATLGEPLCAAIHLPQLVRHARPVPDESHGPSVGAAHDIQSSKASCVQRQVAVASARWLCVYLFNPEAELSTRAFRRPEIGTSGRQTEALDLGRGDAVAELHPALPYPQQAAMTQPPAHSRVLRAQVLRHYCHGEQSLRFQHSPARERQRWDVHPLGQPAERLHAGLGDSAPSSKAVAADAATLRLL